ncbi:MAG: YceD family protein [bacterium]
MKINIEELANLPENQITLNFHETISDLNNNTPINGVIIAYLTSYGVKIEGNIETDMILECDRCLKSYSCHININIDEKFVKDSIILEGTRDLELTNENFVEELDNRSEIDITDLVYQYIILNLPGKKLCYSECPGTEEIQKLKTEKSLDPRLEVFKNILEKKPDNSKKTNKE